MLEVGLHALLIADAGLQALVGDSIYPVSAPPEEPVPFLTYQSVSGTGDYSFDSRQTRMRRIQFDAFAKSYLDTKSILNALRNALDALRGQTLSDGTLVLSAFRSIELDNFESDSRAYRSVCEYEITYIEPA